jgi:tetratricopeptide (TPR) repeat protein
MRLGRWVGFQNAILALLTGALIVLSPGCNSAPKLPEKNSKAYAEVVSAFYVGLSALQVGDDVHAEGKLSEVTHLVPGEPAGWANWGILALRQRNYDTAAQRFQQAHDLAPKNDQIYSLMGLLEIQRGNSAQALADLRQAVELNPQNLRALYQLAEETERQGAGNSEAEFQQLVQKILAVQPNNLAALLELSRIAAKRGDAATVKSAVAQISAQASGWPAEVQHQLAAVQTAVSGSVDFNYDFKTDLVLAGAGGVRLFRQDSPSAFTDVTAKSKLPKSVIECFTIPGLGPLTLKRTAISISCWARAMDCRRAAEQWRRHVPARFILLPESRACADLPGPIFDGDGNPDAAIIDGAGRLHVFMNERQGQFRERPLPQRVAARQSDCGSRREQRRGSRSAGSQADGAILRISDKNEGESWETAEIARVPDAANNLAGDVRLHIADLDNNGALDLILSSEGIAPVAAR